MVPNKIFLLGAISNDAQQNNFENKMLSNSFQIFGITHLPNLKNMEFVTFVILVDEYHLFIWYLK